MKEREAAMGDLEAVTAALNLEYGADRRYAHQISRSPFPRLNAILEGVRRSEGDHAETLFAYLAAHQETGESGRGFATLLTHLRLNLAFEQHAVGSYMRFARESDDPVLKETFRALGRSESGHIVLFKALIAAIEANTYPVIVYCPVCGWEVDFGADPAPDATVCCDKCKQRIALDVVNGDFVPRAVEK
jgi:rubrerythrin